MGCLRVKSPMLDCIIAIWRQDQFECIKRRWCEVVFEEKGFTPYTTDVHIEMARDVYIVGGRVSNITYIHDVVPRWGPSWAMMIDFPNGMRLPLYGDVHIVFNGEPRLDTSELWPWSLSQCMYLLLRAFGALANATRCRALKDLWRQSPRSGLD